MAAGDYWCVEWHSELPSTMTRAEQVAPDAASGSVIVADFQSRGRGTRGRVWQAPVGTCLMFTIISRAPIAVDVLESLPCRVSIDIASALYDDFGLDCDVKEPNDIVARGRKLCGVLCASHVIGREVAWVLCGIGLNTTMTLAQLPRHDATSLQLEGITPPRHDLLLERLLMRLTWLRDGW